MEWKENPHKGKKILANCLLDTGLIPRTYKELKKNQTPNSNTQSKKWASEMIIHFSEEETQIANKYMKKYSTSLVIWQMQIKTKLRFPPEKSAFYQKISKFCGEKGTFSTVGGSVDWYHCGNQSANSLKN